MAAQLPHQALELPISQVATINAGSESRSGTAVPAAQAKTPSAEETGSKAQSGTAIGAAKIGPTSRPSHQEGQQMPRQEGRSSQPCPPSGNEPQPQDKAEVKVIATPKTPSTSFPATPSHTQVKILKRPESDAQIPVAEGVASIVSTPPAQHRKEESRTRGVPVPAESNTSSHQHGNQAKASSEGAPPSTSRPPLISASYLDAASCSKDRKGHRKRSSSRTRHKASPSTPALAPEQGRQQVSSRELERIWWRHLSTLPAVDEVLLQAELVNYVGRNLHPHGQLFGLQALDPASSSRNVGRSQHNPPDERIRQRSLIRQNAIRGTSGQYFHLPPLNQWSLPDPIAFVPVASCDYVEVTTLARDLLNSRYGKHQAMVRQELFRHSMVVNGSQSIGAKAAVLSCYANSNLQEAMIAAMTLGDDVLTQETVSMSSTNVDTASSTRRSTSVGEIPLQEAEMEGAGDGLSLNGAAPHRPGLRRPDNSSQGSPAIIALDGATRQQQPKAPASNVIDPALARHEQGQKRQVHFDQHGNEGKIAVQEQSRSVVSLPPSENPIIRASRDPRRSAVVTESRKTPISSSCQYPGSQTGRQEDPQRGVSYAEAPTTEGSRHLKGVSGTKGGPTVRVKGMGQQSTTCNSLEGVMKAFSEFDRKQVSTSDEVGNEAGPSKQIPLDKHPYSETPLTSNSLPDSTGGSSSLSVRRTEKGTTDPPGSTTQTFGQPEGHPGDFPVISVPLAKASSPSGSSRSSSGSEQGTLFSSGGHADERARRDTQPCSKEWRMGQRDSYQDPTTQTMVMVTGAHTQCQFALHPPVDTLPPSLFPDVPMADMVQMIEVPRSEQEGTPTLDPQPTISNFEGLSTESGGHPIGVIDETLPSDIFIQDDDELILSAGAADCNLDNADRA
ncbi:MAG: hypothetical protein VX724_00700 [Chloroflexota bacterium]|nr:hypothetical protein [Chloroflexota bacterium]